MRSTRFLVPKIFQNLESLVLEKSRRKPGRSASSEDRRRGLEDGGEDTCVLGVATEGSEPYCLGAGSSLMSLLEVLDSDLIGRMAQHRENAAAVGLAADNPLA